MTVYTDTDGNTEWTACESDRLYVAIVAPDGDDNRCGAAVYLCRADALDGSIAPEVSRTFRNTDAAIAFARSL